MYGIVSDIFIKRPYSFFFSICPEYKIQGHVPYIALTNSHPIMSTGYGSSTVPVQYSYSYEYCKDSLLY